MLQIRRLLCPDDFSPFSRRALDYSGVLARWLGAELTAVHVLAAPSRELPLEVALHPVGHASLAPARQELEERVGPLREAGVAVEVSVAEGDPALTVVELAKKVHADLLVMGTHGRGGFERWLLGSVTEKVLRRATCPVLTIARQPLTPRPAKGSPFARILCPVDFSPASRKALAAALALGELGHTRLTLLHVLELEREVDSQDFARRRAQAEQELETMLAELAPEDLASRAERVVVGSSQKAWQEVLRLASERDADLIALGAEGRSPLGAFFFGSNANQIVRGAACPVLTLR